MRRLPVLLASIVVLGLGSSAHAASNGFGSTGFAPRVPVSPLALSWFDASRLDVSSTLSVGSGSGFGTNALQVTRLSYSFDAPVWLSLSLGNSFGPAAGRSSGQFFLEGLEAAFRPTPNMLFQIQYRDFRSPLQMAPLGASPFLQDGWGR
jgi:hypothetical protein